MDLKLTEIDHGQAFDFGKTSQEYARYRDIYPDSLFDKLAFFGIGKKGQTILDVGTGTGVLPRRLHATGAALYGLDISPQQIAEAESLSKGMGIIYRAAEADRTGFEDGSFDAVTACQCFHYLSTDRFVPELRRILLPGGAFCIIAMDWLPHEDPMTAEMERLVLSYNPAWTGCNFCPGEFSVPDWSRELFEVETYHAYREELLFTVDAWCGRIRTCRGVGASLGEEQIQAFERDHRALLARYAVDGKLRIPHYIRIEIYRRRKGR